KKKALRSDLFTKDFFEERNLSPDHKDAKTHRKVQYLNCPDYNITNLWHYIEVHHPEKDPRSNKRAKKNSEGQSTLDEFVGQI
ncbi:9259_t:CDS:2, partial [Funneliformis geosporum]